MYDIMQTKTEASYNFLVSSFDVVGGGAGMGITALSYKQLSVTALVGSNPILPAPCDILLYSSIL